MEFQKERREWSRNKKLKNILGKDFPNLGKDNVQNSL